MSNERFLKGKSRLIQHETDVHNYKQLSRKVGIVIPEDTVTIPKIGQWSLSSSNIQAPTMKPPHPTRVKTAASMRPKENEDASLINNFSPKKSASRTMNKKSPTRPTTAKKGITKISIPKAQINSINVMNVTEKLVDFPQGTVTTDIDEILRSKYRRPSTAVPPIIPQTPEKDEFSVDTRFFPLEYFDDTSFEEFSLPELMKDPNAFSQYNNNGQIKWEECTVLKYDEKTKFFLIEWKKTKKQKKVPRFNLRFARENPEKFAKRIENAKNNCKKYENQLRFDAQVNMKSLENLPSLAENDFIEMHMRVNLDLKPKYVAMLNELDQEVKINFKKLENQLEFEYELEQNPLIPYRDEFLSLRPPQPPVPSCGLVCRTSFSFQKILNRIIETNILAEPFLQEGIFGVWEIFQNTESLVFYTSGFPSEILTLEEFITRQKKLLESTSNSFKKSIQDTLEGVIVSTITSQPDSMNSQNYGKFKKMVIVTVRMLHTVLLRIVQETLTQFLSLFGKFSIKNPNEEICFVIKDNTYHPQFIVDLVFNKENGKLESNPSYDSYQNEIGELLNILEHTVKVLPVLQSAMIDVDTSNVSFGDCLKYVCSKKSVLADYIEELFHPVLEFIDENRSYEEFLNLNPSEYVEKFDPKGKRSLEEYREHINDCNKILNIVQHEMKPMYDKELFRISCIDFKEKTSEHLKDLIYNFLFRVKKFAVETIEEVKNEFEDISENLKKIPQTPEELGALNQYIKKVHNTEKIRAEKMEHSSQRFSFLDEFHFAISNDEIAVRYHTLQMPAKINYIIEETERSNTVVKTKMMSELKMQRLNLDKEALAVTEDLTTFRNTYNDIEMAVEAADEINIIDKKIQKLRELNEKYTSHEKLFECELNPSKLLQNVVDEFTPLHILWNLANEWFNANTAWLDTPFPQVRADNMNQFMIQSTKKITKLRRDLNNKILIDGVLRPLSEQIDLFKEKCPLIVKLRHPGIKTMHWEMISEIVGFTVMPSMELSLQEFLNLNLERWSEQIFEIANVAALEYSLESSLDQMDNELQTMKFITVEYRDSKTYILQQIDEIISTIDDQLVTTQTLLTSPYIKPMLKRATDKLTFLHAAHETLDAWVTCQKSWLYLQPIFTGTSIQQKLYKEAIQWNTVQSIWSTLMNHTHAHPEFTTVMSRDNVLHDLKKCNELLESITKGLNAYLESKRLGFPRFFFLSNDELISILSHTKDFDKIQESMQKLFEYVNSITVTNDFYITQMNDAIGEKVDLVNHISGDTPEIEDWLNGFEEEMKNTLKDNIVKALDSSNQTTKKQWYSDYPAQAIIIASQILWTSQVTQTFKSTKANRMTLLQQKYIEILDQLTDYIRQPISRLHRQLTSCLLINQVHNRDIINQLADANVSDADDFKWAKQLRYYLDQGIVIVRSINNQFEYSYEYAGNSARLVITPLTDRCYQTLLAAFKQHLSGAPSGPAGTGKTETVRDCAKALGRPCVVYNCSEEVTPEQMSQFFAGLSSSGSWSCFDEFNRINIEVLSVIAQQVRSIQEAIAGSMETFKLDARTLKVNPNAAICITMNPGYAGRTELPDNLKALFRPVAMMVPDFVFISEIMLFSGGFSTASVLSVKLGALFDLCRKQLSNARHYDWGLRAMKAILSTAGKAKRNDLNANEAYLLVRTIRDCTAPRLISSDLPLFNGIITDVFPTVVFEKERPEKLVEQLKIVFKEMKHQPLPVFLDKCVEFHETTLVRHGIMLIGGSFGGKSATWKAMGKALTDIHQQSKEGMSVHIEHLNPKAISIAELYGAFNPATSEWFDGVLSHAIRSCSFSEQNEHKWIIVDGPVDSLWIESMNSLLDDNKVLCLPNNERIQLGPEVKLIFEVDDLSQASPATVSRAGMVYFDPSCLTWEAIVDSTLNEIEHSEHIKKLCHLYIPPMKKFLEVDAKLAIEISSHVVVSSLIGLFSCFKDLLRKPKEITSNDDDEQKFIDPLNDILYYSLFSDYSDREIPYFYSSPDRLPKAVEMAFIFSLIWSFGAVLSEDCRLTFDKFLREKMHENNSLCDFPTENTVFNYFADFSCLKWTEWVDGKTNIDFTLSQSVENQLIPTNECAAPIFLSRLLIEHHKSIVLQGPPTSKTLISRILTYNILDQKEFDCHNYPLSSCSTPANIASFMMQFMHKHQGKFGPLPNQSLIFTIDNLGAPKPEVYGAQPPLELLRQFFDYGGWYNTKTVTFNKIVNTSILATVSESANGSCLPSRLIRHFYPIHIPSYSSDTLNNIFTTLLSQRLSEFNGQIKDEIQNIANATINVYNECKENLLPIPSKLHYVFSFRNIIRILRGLLMTRPAFTTTRGEFLRLWYHEMQREIEDRLSTEKDRKWFLSVLEKESKNNMNFEIPNDTTVLFNEFSDDSKKYKEVKKSPEELLKACTALLEDHNSDASKPIAITLFQEAVSHLSAISRVFSMRRGHAMLVGVKSSGRKSLARLGLFISDMELFEISITRSYGFIDWREDIKKVVKQCGVENTETAFIISDVQIIMQQQLEDLSNLVSTCEIPQLFERDEFEGIKAELAQQELLSDATAVNNIFISRIQKNLHIILVASPFGSVFKDSMLNFPNLRNEMAIDWYLPWSENALKSIAYASINQNSVGGVEVVDSVVQSFVKIHKFVEHEASKYLSTTKRFTAVTPSKYFELIQTFKIKLKKKQRQTIELIKKYENGVEKIKTTRASISTMSHQLDTDIPKLQKTRGEVKLMLGELQVQQEEVEENKAEVKEKSIIAAKEAASAKRANSIAQKELKKAEPLLEEAQEAVNRLDKDSLVNIKKLHNPSAGMKDTFDAVCIMFNRAPRKVDGAMPGEKIDDYWPEAVSLLNDFNFIKNVQSYRMDIIPKEIIHKLNKYVNNNVRAEKRKAALASFQAVAALYDWVCASYDYWHVYQEILPKKRKAEKTAKKLEETQAILAKAKGRLKEVEAKLQKLMDNVQEMQKKENELAQNVTNTQKRLERARKILSGLEGEAKRWVESANKLKFSAQFILGDTILISSALTYLGAFSPSFRSEIIDEWKKFMKEANLKFNENITIENSIGNEAVIRDWVLKGLPNDTHSIENALIIQENETCYPLLIDPQLSGTKWLQTVLDNQLHLLSFDQPDFLHVLKNCVSLGYSVIIENVGLKLDPLIDPILSREISNIDGQKRICLGGEFVDYNEKFRLYISTKYPNPHYSPEVCSQMTLINFTTTQDGLSDLLINNLLEVEKSDLEKMRVSLMEAKAENMKKLKDIEDEILQIVSNASGDILDDDTAIETLQRAQATSADIEQQMIAAEQTESEISEFKTQFLPVSDRAALLYFCVSDFSVIDPMYQFSLKWFVPLFRNSIQNANHKGDLVENFKNSVASSFYDSVSFSLFSRHKLLFSTLMTIRILLYEKRVNSSELAFLLSPNVVHQKSEISWINDDIWSLLVAMKDISPTLSDVFNSIKENSENWKQYYNSISPEKAEIPFQNQYSLSSFQKLLILRVFHLEKVREGLRLFISNELGEQFISPPTLNLVNIFKESDPLSPLIFIIMPGIDPQDEIINVAQILETEKYLKSYSLGRGRGQGAEDLINDSAERGFWVLLQNCHLSLSFMPRLEYIISHLDSEKTHKRFRLCLVTMSSPDFPIGILYQGTKLIYEIPKGIRENVTRLYGLFNEEDYDSIDSLTHEKRMTFNLAFFHAVVLERLQFGSIGWNIPYEFNPSDFTISRKHLRSFLNENESRKIPLEELLYVIGELDYGGRVTDAWDRRLLLSLLNQFFAGKNFVSERKYPTPDLMGTMQELLDTVSEWSTITSGSDVGLGENASTIIARNEAMKIFDSLIEVQPTLVAASESISEEQFALNLVQSLQKQVPRQFNRRNFKNKFDKSQTMTTVLEHEVILYNNLITVIVDSLKQMEKGLKGLILIDESLETFNRSLLSNKVPELWLRNSFPSILSLSSYMSDLNKRVEFLNGWLNNGQQPEFIFLGGFFHPEEFLTAVLQSYARKHKVPFDSLGWVSSPVSYKEAKNNMLEEGVYIEGLMLEGAKWDTVESKLIECGEKDLNNQLPIIKLVPSQDKSPYNLSKTYECPVFRTQNRGTGALDLPNYIFSLFLPTPTIKPDQWVQRSVAAFITI
ncbi:Dynein heavy chain family protein [Tritrichomonas foetus]|uniref:Dynein heavy chain family protein n=1 Tax=Tritrichomonas foetus TaxID=1144522 RepID=A0A1J4KQR9_9EUKA|nr:Dynein heavy chain family protein [Tritrichomonas foetus]|eukprot:OHT13633.1 Dynein heavy chain family protein [Tritrichomonas foetus]